MNLQDLISQLELAAGLATDGELTADGRYLDVWHEGKLIDSPVEATTTDAQAIAIRHNTAAMVLEMLDSYKRLLAWVNPPANPPTPPEATP